MRTCPVFAWVCEHCVGLWPVCPRELDCVPFVDPCSNQKKQNVTFRAHLVESCLDFSSFVNGSRFQIPTHLHSHTSVSSTVLDRAHSIPRGAGGGAGSAAVLLEAVLEEPNHGL